MTFDAGYTLAVIAGMMAALASNRVGVDLIMLGALALLLVAGIIAPGQAFAGFANEGLLTVAFLYVVVAGLRNSGVVSLLTARVLGKPSSEMNAQARVILPVAGLSAFMNNTPLVAVYLPMLDGFARRYGIAPSRLFLPLSYAAILGGVCTLIGTSTNVVVNGLILEHNRVAGAVPIAPFTMFSMTPVGLPVALAGIAYILAAGRHLLPARQTPIEDEGDRRHYTVAMRVEPAAQIVGRTLEGAGLRNLSGLFLAHIERHQDIEHAVGPDEVLREGDVLVFVGVLESVVDLQQIRGLTPVTWEAGWGNRQDNRLIEAVISPSSPLVGQTIRDGGFRTRFGGVIVAVHRHGERLKGKIGDIRMRPGDTLLIEAQPGFGKRHQNSSAFHLVTEHQGAAAPRHERAWIALLLLAAFVASSSVGWLDTLTAAMLAAAGMVLFRCTDGPLARETVDWQVLIVIGAGIGVGKAVELSGLAEVLARVVLGPAGATGAWVLLAGVYALTWALTSVLSNSAAAVLVFPVALHAVQTAGLAFEPFAIAIALAASCEFTTSVGYQTNLMVQGPGGYRPLDYVRFGAPLTLICGVVTVTVLSWLY
ncbi:MAG TPA: SLC13 family permease [Vicinamibacterales bacterium]|nr:SLC13 family permease [Vicinamibacterales bacterium]